MLIIFVFTVATAPLTVPGLSYGKYVLDPIVYPITFHSAENLTVTAIGAISGAARVGETLTAGALTPAEASVTYQWQRSSAAGVAYEDIAGATADTYTLTAGDGNCYIRVVATGTGAYTGTVTSAAIGPVETPATPVTSIGPVSGAAQVGETLTAGVLTPAEASVTYQWQRSGNGGESYENIAGATADTYTLTAGDDNCYIRVVATGTGAYTGTATSAATGPVETPAAPITQITAIGRIRGTTAVDETLTAGTLTPFGATASYQWQRSDSTGAFTNIAGATSVTYTLTGPDSYCYIRVVATGTGDYTGTVTSEYVGRVLDKSATIPLTGMEAIGGVSGVGQTLTAGTVSPAGAIVTYQWQRAGAAGGTYADIAGATTDSYTLTPADKDQYIRVAAIGSGNYTGTLFSEPRGPIAAGQITAMGPISGTTAVGRILTAGAVTPLNADVTYQWQRCADSNGDYVNIPGATSKTYTLTAGDEGFFIKVIVTGAGAYTGSAVSASTGPVGVTATPITAIGIISGTAQVTRTLTAGTVSPAGAGVTYQWLRGDTEDGAYQNIAGATANSYTLTAADMGKYIKVRVTGAGNYTGTATSAYKGPVAAGLITAIGPIRGTTVQGQTLTVGDLTPYGATATYQWQRSDGTEPFTDIVGGTASAYTLRGEDSYRYIRVVATGTGAYTGTVISDYTGRVIDTATPLTAIEAISGAAEVSRTLTAGTLSPAGAMATYQWQRAGAADGIYGNIPGATAASYTLTATDKDQYIKVVATGAGNYSGTVASAPKGPVVAGQLTAIGAIGGTTVIGQTLTAGAVTPLEATVTWQWQRCASAGGTYENIANANSSAYTLKAGDEGFYLRVAATGSGAYTGTVVSSLAGPVGDTMTVITSMGVISGTARVAQTLTAGTVSPSGAAVTYQWLRCAAAEGAYENIPGATAGSYTLTAADKDQYIKVMATGAGNCSGTAVSPAKGPVVAGQLTAIGAISGTTKIGQTLTAGALTPYGATAAYQWQRSIEDGVFIDIVGGTASAYTVMGEDSWRYIRVVATGTGAYTGTVYSDQVGRVVDNITPLTAIGAVDGIAAVGQTLTAGALSPAGTATYQWLRADTADGAYAAITGATASSYTLTPADKDRFIKVRATGNGTYSGTVTSAYKGPVAAGRITAIGAVSGTTVVGQTLTAGALTPLPATAVYQWQRCDTVDGTYEDIPNATALSYTLKAADTGYYIKVVATGAGAYTGTAVSSPTGPVGVATNAITAIGAISGTAQVGMVLTAGPVSPSGATATYQWLKSAAEDGIYEDITGATSPSYTLTPADLAYYIKVQATGSGVYSETATSASRGPVAAGQITAISNITGTTAAGRTLTAGTVSPLGATVTYQWSYSGSLNGAYTNIGGATGSTYTLSDSNNGKYIRVTAIGIGAYTGTATSSCTGPVSGSVTELTSLGAISGAAAVGATLTAGTLSPSAATVTWQWQRCTTPDGDYVNIAGAASNTYLVGADDADQYLRVKATGSGNYSGTVISDYIGPVEPLAGQQMLAPEELQPEQELLEEEQSLPAEEQLTTAGEITEDGAAVDGTEQDNEAAVDGTKQNSEAAVDGTESENEPAVEEEAQAERHDSDGGAVTETGAETDLEDEDAGVEAETGESAAAEDENAGAEAETGESAGLEDESADAAETDESPALENEGADAETETGESPSLESESVGSEKDTGGSPGLQDDRNPGHEEAEADTGSGGEDADSHSVNPDTGSGASGAGDTGTTNAGADGDNSMNE